MHHFAVVMLLKRFVNRAGIYWTPNNYDTLQKWEGVAEADRLGSSYTVIR